MPIDSAAPLWRRFLVFLGPLVLTNVLQALGGTITTIWVWKRRPIARLA